MSQLKVNTIRHTGASSDAVTLASDGTCTAKITNNLSNRNLIINGAMQVAQRGTSITAEGYVCDRWRTAYANLDEAPTTTQHALTSSDTGPWAEGFRYSTHVQNGNQTSGAGASDYLIHEYRMEAQDLANSGWDYTSASSYITLSFWVKSSVAQNFYGYLRSYDGTQQLYCFETGSLSANTWTKITKKIPGNSNIQIDNNNDTGMEISFAQWWGGTWTNNNSLNTWAAFDTNNRTPDQTSTWFTTNDATFELTGVQFEVGDVATNFEHRPYDYELRRCQRYYFRQADGLNKSIGVCVMYDDNNIFPQVPFPVTMRTTPTLDVADGTSYFRVYSSTSSDNFDTFSSIWNAQPNCAGLNAYSADGVSGRTVGHSGMLITQHNSAYLAFSAEL